MFYQVTNAHDFPGNYLETSGSCAIAYSLMKGARLGYLPTYYYDYGKEIFDSIVTHKLVITDDNFDLKDICLVAGLGGMAGKGDYQPRDGTVEYYVSEPKVNNDAKGVAPFLFAYSEICRKEGI
jgi:unsaturated rhamnogalacturonyl hydrolase